MTAISPLLMTDVVRALVSSTTALLQGTLPQTVLEDLAPQMERWFGVEELASHLEPIADLLRPMEGTDRFSKPVRTSELAQALHGVGSNLHPLASGLESEFLVRMNQKLSGLIGAATPAGSRGVRSGIMLRVRAEAISKATIRHQMMRALKISIAGPLHDANNMLTPLNVRLVMASKELERVNALAEKNLPLVPTGVRAEAQEYLDAVGENFRDIERLTIATTGLVRKGWSLIGLTSVLSEKDLADAPHLFSDQGLIPHISATLTEILNGLPQARERVSHLRRMCDEHGHWVPPRVIDEAKELLKSLSECLQTVEDLTTRMVDLFHLLNSVGHGLNEEEALSIDLQDYMEKNQRLIRAVMGKMVTVDFADQVGLQVEPWTIHTFNIHVWQVLLNLIVNARDAMENGGALSISISKRSLSDADVISLSAPLIRPRPKTGEFMVLRVQDTGSGIPPHTLPKIFDLSFSGKKSSGLGLSVTLEIVEKLGGFITVETPLNPRGTAFSVYFPREGSESGADHGADGVDPQRLVVQAGNKR